MSLEATHIRFALDLKDILGVKNISEYLSGTVYPDSRYVSGISREATHSHEKEQKMKQSMDDFEKGWYVHLLCDKIFNTVRTKTYPFLFEGVSKETHLKEWWHRSSALKVIQDIYNTSNIDGQSLVTLLVSDRTPSDEPVESIKRYHKAIIDLYQQIPTIPTSYRALWFVFNIQETSMDAIISYVDEYLNIDTVKNTQGQLYQEALRLAKKEI